MFKHIMTPVDLGHAGRLDRALQVTADLAKHYGADVTFVGVTWPQPSKIAHSPEEFARKLQTFAEEQKSERGIAEARSHMIVAHDPSIDLDPRLAAAVDEVGADLIVMGSHIPRHFEFSSHGAALASHTDASILLIRDPA